MVNIYFHTAKEKKLKVISQFKKGSWIHMENPSAKEISEISKVINIDESLCLDAIDPYEVPRIEREDGVTYFFTRVPKNGSSEVVTIPLLVAIGEDFILTVIREKAVFLEDFLKGKNEFNTNQRIKFFLQILFAINTQYSIFLNDIGRKIRAIKVKIRKLSSKDIVQFVDYEKILNDFLSALVPTSSVLSSLTEGRHIDFFEKDQDLLEDVYLGNRQLVELAKSTLRYSINVREAYSTIITNELNRVIKFLTSLTILLTVPTMIASFFGMNVTLPFDKNPLAFVGIVFSTALISLTLFLLFSKKDWI